MSIVSPTIHTAAVAALETAVNRALSLGPGGLRLGYGGGFYDRTLATVQPRPLTVGVAYTHGFVPWLEAESHDVPLDVILTDEGVYWQRPGL